MVGGNLCTVNLLQETPYMPSLDGAVLMVEDDHPSQAKELSGQPVTRPISSCTSW
jgi:muramoyltetrapeptide carboxypeptidase LdcA involved in peptidoglycan recycling